MPSPSMFDAGAAITEPAPLPDLHPSAGGDGGAVRHEADPMRAPGFDRSGH